MPENGGVIGQPVQCCNTHDRIDRVVKWQGRTQVSLEDLHAVGVGAQPSTRRGEYALRAIDGLTRPSGSIGSNRTVSRPVPQPKSATCSLPVSLSREIVSAAHLSCGKGKLSYVSASQSRGR